MKYRLLNYLACPYCKDRGFPLEIIVFEVKEYSGRSIQGVEKPLCDLYCGFMGKFIKDLGSAHICDKCIRYEVVEGILYCRSCGRWYPIINEIPRLLPDHYRSRDEDIEFLKRHEDRIPDEIKLRGKPYNLSS